MNEPKFQGLPGKLTSNELTERKDDFTFNVTYTTSRSIDDICRLAANDKYPASELKAVYDLLLAKAKSEMYTGATVEFGFAINSLGVTGSFIGPKAQFDPAKNTVVLRCTPRTSTYRAELQTIPIIVTSVEDGLPTIITVYDVKTQTTNEFITPGGMVNVKTSKGKITATEGCGVFFLDSEGQVAASVGVADMGTNTKSQLSFVVPPLAAGTYRLKLVTDFSGNDAKPLKTLRENVFPYEMEVIEAKG